MFTRESLARNKELVKAIDYRGLVELNFLSLFLRVLRHPFHAQQRVHLLVGENLSLVSASDKR